jgi:hypothetical protein
LNKQDNKVNTIATFNASCENIAWNAQLFCGIVEAAIRKKKTKSQ